MKDFLNDEVARVRVMDPQRGMFCSVTKAGLPTNFPPDKREPVQNRETNPKGTRHISKTLEDSQKVTDRRRYQQWLRTQ